MVFNRGKNNVYSCKESVSSRRMIFKRGKKNVYTSKDSVMYPMVDIELGQWNKDDLFF